MDTGGLVEQDMLELLMPEHENGHRCRIRAWVVHRGEEGIGVAFNTFGEGDYGCLKRLIDAIADEERQNQPVSTPENVAD